MDKTMVLYRKLWNFDLRRKKAWQINTKLRNYNGEYHSNIPKLLYGIEKLWYYGDKKTIEKTMLL